MKIDNKERRFGLVEARAATEDEKLILEGYAVIFNSETIDEEFLPTLTSPNGTKYKITVADGGTLSATAV